jgi:hypothetical protein
MTAVETIKDINGYKKDRTRDNIPMMEKNPANPKRRIANE